MFRTSAVGEENMKTLRSWLVLTLVVLLGAGTAAPAFAKQLEGIPLVWKPTTQIGEAGAIDLTGIGQTRVRVEGLTDSRENASLIGENREAKTPKTVSTNDNVAAWCTSRLKALLGQFGLNVVEDRAEVTITGEVKRFFVAETHVYEGDVRLKIEVMDKDGKTLWLGLTGGTVNRFGRSYKAENYYEALSDSFLGAVQNLFQNDGFREALKRH